MVKATLLVLGLLGVMWQAGADALGDAQYAPPAGWAVEKHDLGVVMAPPGEDATAVLVLYAAVKLGDQTFREWFDAELAGSITPPAKVLEAAPVEVGERNGLDVLTSLRAVQDTDGAGRLQLCHAISDGTRAVLVLGIAADAEAVEKHGDTIAGFLRSLDLTGRTPLAGANPEPAPGAGQGDSLPQAGLVNGRPQGLFSGVSVLSGNPAAMLFLEGGRVYHGIPAASLNKIDWQQLMADSSSRCSQWEMQGNTLRIIWPDGNVWESPVEPTATGFRFNGKSYGATHPVDMAHLAGTWEGTKSTAWLNMGSGPAVTQINNLQIAADGSYTWGVATGGEVEGATAYSEAAFAGKVEIDGYEAVFHANDGKSRRLSLTRWKDPDTLILGGGFYFRK